MRNTITRSTIAGLAALSLMGSLIATSEPAAAQFHGGGRGGGFHGGGFHGGGWHGGWRSAFRFGWGVPGFYGYGYAPYPYPYAAYYPAPTVYAAPAPPVYHHYHHVVHRSCSCSCCS